MRRSLHLRANASRKTRAMDPGCQYKCSRPQEEMTNTIKRKTGRVAAVTNLEVSSAVANTAVGQILLQVCSRRLAPLAGVDIQDGGASLQVGQWEHQLPVKPVMQESSLALVVRSSGIHWMRAEAFSPTNPAWLV